MAKGKGNWSRPYHVCKGKGCNNWCWASQVPSQPLCSACGKKWPGVPPPPGPKPPTQSQLQRLDRPRRAKPEDSQPKGFLKVLKERWADLGPATQEALQAAGFQPKPPPPGEDSLLTRLLGRKGDLPADIQAMLELEAGKPSATPYEEGQHSSNALTKASHKYRQLARKKMDLQASITQTKEHLKALVEETQSVDKQMDEAKQAIEDAQSKLSEALEQGNSVSVAHPSLGDIAAFEGIGKSLGIEFSEEQLSVLRKASAAQMPPGLGVTRPTFVFGPKQPGPADPPEGTGPKEPPPQDKPEGPDVSMKDGAGGELEELSQGRDRSPRRASRGSSKETLAE